MQSTRPYGLSRSQRTSPKIPRDRNREEPKPICNIPNIYILLPLHPPSPITQAPPLLFTNVYPSISHTSAKQTWKNPTHLQIIPRRDRQHPLPSQIRHQCKLMSTSFSFIVPFPCILILLRISASRRRSRLLRRGVSSCIPFRCSKALPVEEFFEGF